jgi:hypothetical protein
MTYLLSSAGALIVDRNAWHTRADQAWGDSQVWNSGASYKTQRDQNATDRDTWHTRADQAWGTSRVWSSGESWEAAYARVLPPAAVDELTASGGEFLYGGLQTYCAITVDRTGYWFVTGQATSITVSTGVLLRFTFNGVFLNDSYNWQASAGERIGTLLCGAARLISAGQQIVFAGDAGGSAARTGSHVMRAVFVPTQTYPH